MAADIDTIAGAGGAALVISLAPRAIELVRTAIAKRSDVEIEHRRAIAREREAAAGLRSDELDIAERLIRDRADEHKACREEVAELRHELRETREEVAACQTQHAEQRARSDAQEHMIEWLRGQVERLSRISHPPQEPAE